MSNQKGFMDVLLLILALVVVGSLYVISKKNSPPTTDIVTNEKTTKPETLPKPISSPSSTGQTPVSAPRATTPKSTAVPASTCKVYTYQDKFTYSLGKHCIDKVTLQGIYFVPKDQTSGIIQNWSNNMIDIFSQIKQFYENQFDNKIMITIDNNPILVNGDLNAEDYNAWTALQEAKRKLEFSNTGSTWTVRMMYIAVGYNNKSIQGTVGAGGGEDGNGTTATNNGSWLDPTVLGYTTKYGADYTGYLASAHEFGHSLGIPHPWEEEVNQKVILCIAPSKCSTETIDPNYGNNEIGSVMSYGGQKGPLIPASFIRTQVKQKMIVP